MRPFRRPSAGATALLGLLAACSADGAGPPAEADVDPRPTTAVVRVIDAGSGEALADSLVTVRYLVRTPIPLRAAAVEEVPAAEPYGIRHEVATDSLVLELRLEAPSYARLDTVVAVARGDSVGPVELPLVFRPDRMASAPGSDPDRDRSSSEAREEPVRTDALDREAPEAATPAGDGVDPDAAVDRRPLRTGDRAFEARAWRDAVGAYAAMPSPEDPTSDYAREYVLARVRKGIAHINLGEWQEALSALRVAVSYDFREYTAYFYLGQVECALGRYDDGRSTLRSVTRRFGPMIPESQRAIVGTLVRFQEASCSYGEFRGASSAEEARRVGARAARELQDFLREAERMAPRPPEVNAAATEARRMLQEIQAALG